MLSDHMGEGLQSSLKQGVVAHLNRHLGEEGSEHFHQSS